MIIAWFDPGKVTGMAVYDTGADVFTSSQHTEEELPGALAELMHRCSEELTVGWELYIQTPRARPGSTAKYSLAAIAAIRSACTEHNVPVLKGQPSSARSLKSSTVFLRRLGWYTPGMQHATDAAAHLFRYLIKQHPVPENIRKRLPAGY